jgi:hypothetical protein
MLRKFDVTACVRHRAVPLSTLLVASRDWQQAYEDEQSVIFVRASQAPHGRGGGNLSKLQ